MRFRALALATSSAVIFLWTQVLMVAAAEVRVVSLPAYKSLLEKLNPAFESATGNRLVIESGVFSQLKGRLDAGDFDVAISSGAVTDYLSKQGMTVPSTRIEFSRIGIGVAVPQGAPKPDISSVAAFKRALLSAKAISIPTRESAAGSYLVNLLDRLGIGDDLKPKVRMTGGGGETPRAIATGQVDIGMSLLSEFVAVRGLEIVGPLPSEIQHYVIQTAAVGTAAKERNASESLVKYLMTPPAIALIKAEGLEPAAPR